ncbi:hypothetical protein [Methanoculleus sp.]|uniref:hypothetical protein n=1 Tax=Methanoculleus sp. TaxID=90427 RepID=UPI0025DD8394|nr:hypothetical protein [Methanoculleus sp.]
MKGKTGMQALSVLLAVMLASAVLVSVVSADVKKCVVGDVVDEATLIERSSSLIREYRTNADAEKAIAAEIQKLPRVSYLAGWSEDDAERVKHVYRSLDLHVPQSGRSVPCLSLILLPGEL